jgi:hypothetical protein
MFWKQQKGGPEKYRDLIPLSSSTSSPPSQSLSLLKITVFWDVAPCSMVEVYQHFRGASITLIMEVASTSETSVNFYQTTQCSIPEAVFILATVRT